MNRENIKKLIDVLEESKTYDQGRWSHNIEGPHCGSPACIAGHAAQLAGATDMGGGRCAVDGKFAFIDDTAIGWMGINSRQSAALVRPLPYGNRREATKADAIATLKHLLETGEVDWKAANKENL